MNLAIRSRVRTGDPEAFRLLFDEFARPLYNHAFRLTGNWSHAEDVLSLTFLEAWRLRSRVDPYGGSLRPWLYGIATNVARNLRRAARRHAAAMARVPTRTEIPDFADDLVGRIDDRALVAAAQAAIQGLRRAEREVLALCVWSGLDYVAAAEALGVPIGTVRSRLSRARRKLRTAFDDRELHPDRGQIQGDRDNAVRHSQEMDR